jgi:hypothetical protein
MSYYIHPSTYTSAYGNITINAASTSATTFAPTWTTSATMNIPNANALTVDYSGRVDLKGEKADITINGVSLNATLKLIQDRLGLLIPNPEMEAEFDELRALSEQYQKLEAECREKMRVWNTLKNKNI